MKGTVEKGRRNDKMVDGEVGKRNRKNNWDTEDISKTVVAVISL